MKRKVQLDDIAEGLCSLGFSDVLSSFTELFKSVFVGGVKKPSTEDFLGHIDIVPPENVGEKTYEFLQQYIVELDEQG